jgi:hypothetical protein
VVTGRTHTSNLGKIVESEVGEKRQAELKTAKADESEVQEKVSFE